MLRLSQGLLLSAILLLLTNPMYPCYMWLFLGSFLAQVIELDAGHNCKEGGVEKRELNLHCKDNQDRQELIRTRHLLLCLTPHRLTNEKVLKELFAWVEKCNATQHWMALQTLFCIILQTL